MPIRFRCAYCNQLMGIARRKAGTVVKCPNCNGQVVVPAEDGGVEDAGTQAPPPPSVAAAPQVAPAPVPVPAPAAPPAPLSPATQQPLFERSDFDEVLKTGGKKSAPPQPMPQPVTAPAPFPPSFQPIPQPVPKLKETILPVSVPLPVPESPSGAVLQLPGAGIVLSPAMATLLSVAVVVALALAFTAGLIVGRLYLQPRPSDDASNSREFHSVRHV